ncbi:exodeoxyribonuclease VII small subunit [Alkalinema sp. FACHB-956]|uniref:exodeoxyribonuclease VII small subunit n=1 Tax=Alkalinema sp. FACHB-956 TaxID=2692768 RepID=UPI0016871985|nr:exodeoxyribonuclease VII small subunit [Alkalinema sp. FACHB-956]MBD2329472.1 exodeoxyribonuclease VII small subunit [Alkalinema sp. FACHB-956]
MVTKRKSKTETLPNNWNYEATVSQVEEILALIESGDLDLAEVFDQFTVAVERLKECDRFLADRQGQVDLLIESLSDEPDF